jgi:hypothetical protein
MFSVIFISENSKTQEPSLAPIGNSLAYLAYLRLRTSIYTRFTSLGASHVLAIFRTKNVNFVLENANLFRMLRLTIL